MLGQHVVQNKGWNYIRGAEGSSLVEVMIALTIFLIIFMGVMQGALLGIDLNMHNILRDEAVSIASAKMEEMRSLPFASVVSDTNALPSGVDCPGTFTIGNRVQRPMRSITKDFCVNLACVDLDGDGDCTTDDSTSNSKQVNIRVTWKWKGEDYLHSVTTVRRR
jgi:Tfp pilus assembly protein PilV